MDQAGPEDHRLDDDGIALYDVLRELRERALFLVAGSLLAGLAALGVAFLIPPTFTATTTFLPPQQHQSAAASALAALGPLTGLPGVGAVRSPGDQYVALMQSVSVADRLIDRFELMKVYDAKLRVDARRRLANQVRIALGRKDGLITVDVDDPTPGRAADLANAYVEELRRVTGELAVTEAQQRRMFFDQQLKQTRDRLASAQQAVQSSGFSVGALRAEPKSAAEGYARLRAEVTAAEVKLQTLQRAFADATPEVQQQRTLLLALRSQLSQLESNIGSSNGSDYISKYREFKYQEALFDLFARQYEMARLDESREGVLVQVVDVATPPERRSRPKRALIAAVTTGVTFIALATIVVLRRSLRRSAHADRRVSNGGPERVASVGH